MSENDVLSIPADRHPGSPVHAKESEVLSIPLDKNTNGLARHLSARERDSAPRQTGIRALTVYRRHHAGLFEED